jgi:hypothetical protein
MVINKTLFPCKDCGDRHVGCHSSCEKYTEAKATYDKQAAWIREMNSAEEDFMDFKINMVIRTRDKSRRK